MDWIRLFPENDLPEGGRKLAQADKRRILVLRFNQKIYAIESNCPHMRFPLKDGRITEDGGIICPFHHSAFDIETGDVKDWAPWPPWIGPIAGAIVRQRVLATFPVKAEGGFIWVSPLPKDV